MADAKMYTRQRQHSIPLNGIHDTSDGRRYAQPNVLLVVNHYLEDLAWIENQTEFPFIVYCKSGNSSTSGTPWRYHDLSDINVGSEAESYLTYIVDHYNWLPETMVFLHGHSMAWHQRLPVMELLGSLGDLTHFNYMNIGNNLWNAFSLTETESFSVFKLQQIERTLGITIFRYSCQHDLWPIMCSAPGSEDTFEKDNGAFLMGVNNSTMPPYILTKAASQYIIHRSLIRSRSHKFWKVLLKKLYVLSDRHFRRSVGYLFEYFFFYIFTGLHDELKYMQDGKYLSHDVVSNNKTQNERRNIWHKTWLNTLLVHDVPGNISSHVPVPLVQAPLPALTAIAASRAKARAAARGRERGRPSEVKLLRHEIKLKAALVYK